MTSAVRTLYCLASFLGMLAALPLAAAETHADASTASSNSASATLDFANGLYARGMYEPAIAEYEKFLKANPGSPESASARFRYADSFYFTKDYASAIAHFELFLKDFPRDKRAELAGFRLGTARYYQGDRARAIREFVRLSRTSADPLIKSGSVFYLAKSLETKGNAQRSLKILERLVEQDPAGEYASYAGVAIGDHYLKEENFNEAVRGYKVAAENPSPPELARQARYKVAEIHFSQKNYADAAAFYQKVFDDPSTSERDLKDKAILGLFYCDYNGGNLEASKRRFSVNQPWIQASGHRSEIFFLFANLLADKKEYDGALNKLEEVLADPGADEALKEKAEFKKISVLSEKGQKDQSLKELEAFFSRSPKNADKALFEKAQLLAEIGKTEEALAAFQKLMTEYPASEFAKNALYQSAMTRMKAGQTEKAGQSFKEYALRNPADPNADLALLQIVQMDLDAKKFNEAFTGAEEFIKKNPSSQRIDVAYYKLGVAATGLGRFGHAAFAFQKILDGSPGSKLYVEALYGAAVSLENAGKIPEAIALYERLLRDNPEHALSAEVLPRLGYLYIRNNDTGKALTYYEDMLFNKKDVKIETDGVFWLIQYLLDQGLYDRLNRILDSLEARFPEKPLKHEVLFFKGEAALGLKDYAKAAGLYTESIKANPEGAYVPHAYLGCGIAFEAADQAAQAETNFSEALKYDQELKVAMRARFELANLRLKAGDLEGAAKAFMLVAILYDDPKYTPPALYKAGECFRSIQKPDESEKAFAELQSRYPNSEWAKKAVSRSSSHG